MKINNFKFQRNFRKTILVPHSRFGTCLPKGKEFIGEKDYISQEELIEQIKDSKKEVILNVGDSSTSGWNTNIIIENRIRWVQALPLLTAFFHYKTYSDFLREQVGDKYYIINAGVPGFSSFQGGLRLSYLINLLKKAGIKPSWVTAYFGNNDCAWGRNKQDRDTLGGKPSKSANFRTKPDDGQIITRVLAFDYKANMKKIIQICRRHKLGVILIEPLTPIYWKPGTVVQGEDWGRMNFLTGSDRVYKMLEESRILWGQVKEAPWSEFKRLVLEEARERDYLIPRVKKGHVEALRALIRETRVPNVRIEDLDRSSDDIKHFIDHCHPYRKANERIAEEIAKIVEGKKEEFQESIEERKDEETFDISSVTSQHYTLF